MVPGKKRAKRVTLTSANVVKQATGPGKKSKKRLELEKGKPFNEKDLKIKSAELSMHFSPVFLLFSRQFHGFQHRIFPQKFIK